MKKRKNRLLRMLHKLHIYSGLSASLFLIIAGISALDFQHHFLSHSPKGGKTCIQQLNVEFLASNDTLIKQINDSIGIYGHIPYWEIRDDSINQVFSYSVFRPGKRYDISVQKKLHKLKITESRMGIGNLLAGLHEGATGAPESMIFAVWGSYARTATVMAIISILTSVYLWFRKSVKHRWQWFIIGFSFSISTFYILFIWLVG